MRPIGNMFTYGTENFNVVTILSHEDGHCHIITPTTQGLTYSDDPLPIDLSPHHTVYYEPMVTMIAELHAVANTTIAPTYTDPIELSQAMKGLHMRDMLGADDDGADDKGVNDIDITRMDQNSPNNDYKLRGKAMDVTQMDFTVDRSLWETNFSRAPSRHISKANAD